MGDLPAVVLANAAAAVVLAVVAAGVCVIARSPAVAHKAWLLVLVKLVTPPLLVLPVVWPAAEAARESGPPPAGGTDAIDLSGGRKPPEEEDDSGGLCPPLGTDDGPPEPTPTEDNPVPSQARADSTEPPPPAIAPFPWRSALVGVWLGGAAGYWLVVAVRVARFRRLLRFASPVPPDVVAAVRATADWLGLRHAPAASFVAAAVSPMVWAGLGRPRLILPRPLWDSLTPDQREAVLAHELAHLRRGDHWVRRLELVVLGVYWWFPVAWLAGRRLRDAEEACCDAWVVWALPGRAVAYAEALVETVAFVSRPGWVPLASGGAARADALKRRLAMILSNSPARTGRRVVAVGLLAAGLVALLFRPGLADDLVAPVEDPAAGEPGDVLVFEFPDDGPQTDPRPKAKPADEPARRADLRFPSSYAPAADVAGLRDELELLEAAGQTKAAQVRAAEVAVKAADRQLGLFKQVPGAVGRSDLETAQSALESAQAQLDVRRAEYGEHAVKVRQAKRRLEAAAGDRPAEMRLDRKPKAVDPPAASPRNRKAPDADVAPGADTMRQIRDELTRTQAILQDLTAKRQQLEDQLKVVSQHQGAVMADMEKLRKVLEDVYKRYPDAGGPKKP